MGARKKKTEWQSLLELASKVEQFTPSVGAGRELIGTIHDPIFRQHLREMTQAGLKCVFISETKAQKIYDRILKVQLVNEESKGHIEDYGSRCEACPVTREAEAFGGSRETCSQN